MVSRQVNPMNIHRIIYFNSVIICICIFLASCSVKTGERIMHPQMSLKQVESRFGSGAVHGVLRINASRSSRLPLDLKAVDNLAFHFLEQSGLHRLDTVPGQAPEPVLELFVLSGSPSSISLSATLHIPKTDGRDVFRLYPPRTIPVRRPGADRTSMANALDAEMAPALDRLLQTILTDLLANEPFTQEENHEPPAV